MRLSVIFSIFLLLVLVAGLLVVRSDRALRPASPTSKPVNIATPLGLPPVVSPADNPPTAETIALGRKLYYDPALSLDSSVSCASCHHPDHGFSDGRRVSAGVQGKTGTRNSPTVFNSAYFATQFWDGRAPSLEVQAEGPVQNPVEMAHTLKGVEQRLMKDPEYRALFKQAFGTDQITYDMAEKSIAAFERTIISGNSPFDRYYYGHDEKAMTPAAIRGFKVFSSADKGNCTACHTIGQDYALFTDNKFHNIGVGVLHVEGKEFADLGRYHVTKTDADRGAFKTPSLRNVALTAPYFHDGSLKTLKDVVDYYVGAGNSNPYLDKQIHVLDFLSGEERADLVAFLESLTGDMPPDVGPPPHVIK